MQSLIFFDRHPFLARNCLYRSKMIQDRLNVIFKRGFFLMGPRWDSVEGFRAKFLCSFRSRLRRWRWATTSIRHVPRAPSTSVLNIGMQARDEADAGGCCFFPNAGEVPWATRPNQKMIGGCFESEPKTWSDWGNSRALGWKSECDEWKNRCNTCCIWGRKAELSINFVLKSDFVQSDASFLCDPNPINSRRCAKRIDGVVG